MKSLGLWIAVWVALWLALADLAHAQRKPGKKGGNPEEQKREMQKYQKSQSQIVQSRTRNELRARYAGLGRSFGYEGSEATIVEERLIDGAVHHRIRYTDLQNLDRRREPAKVREALADYLLTGLRLGAFEPVGHHVEHEKCSSESASAECTQRPMSKRMSCMLEEWPEFQFDALAEELWIARAHAAQELLDKPVTPGPVRTVSYDVATQLLTTDCTEILKKM